MPAQTTGDPLLKSRAQHVLGVLYIAEVSLVLCILTLYRVNGKENVRDFLMSRPGWVCLALALCTLAAAIIFARILLREWQTQSRKLLLSIVFNVFSIGVLIGLGEAGLRLIATQAPDRQIYIGSLRLLPRDWQRTAEFYSSVLAEQAQTGSYHVGDPLLGWVPASSRESRNGLYFSSVEGLRSIRPGIKLRAESSECAIALVGDSNTFGEVVRFEDTWAHQLQLSLDSKCRVLNFGVGGYGIDQMYLRYRRDVQSWNPQLVILAFINDDLMRTMSAYGFLMFPLGVEPWVKPRFTVSENGRLNVINAPLVSPRDVFAAPSISDLPYVQHDAKFQREQWDFDAWRLAYHSYIFRLMISLFPLQEKERPEVSIAETTSVNAGLLRAFMEEAAAHRTRTMIVFLPDDLTTQTTETHVPLGIRLLQDSNIPYVDMRGCFKGRTQDELFNPPEIGGHYTPLGNKLMAGCLKDEVAKRLGY